MHTVLTEERCCRFVYCCNFNFFIVSEKETKQEVDTGFIPGIYNYCDRWCEKCELSHKCLTHVMGTKLAARKELKPDKNMPRGMKGLQLRLRIFLKLVKEIMKEMAEERGIAVKDICDSEDLMEGCLLRKGGDVPVDKKRMDAAGKTDIVRTSMIYEALGEKCLEAIYETLDTDPDDESLVYDKDPDLAVVGWYVSFVESKLRRAVYDMNSPEQERILRNEDYNGSVKVALIGMDRSLVSWEVVREKFPGWEKDIDRILVVLKELLKDVEEQFPDARAFLRPGFEK